MARSPQAIETSLIEQHTAANPAMDTNKGPVYDHLVRPFSQVFSEIEVRQDRTDRMVTSDFSSAANDAELARMAATVGAGPSQGSVATGIVIIGSNSRPLTGTVVTIPKGTLVADASLTYVYQTLEAATINGTFAENYLNPAKRTYEVSVPVQATAIGGSYNLPSYRVRRLVSRINGIDFVENRQAMQDGGDPGGRAATLQRAQSKLTGQDASTSGGLAAAILGSFSAVTAVQIVPSTDYALFRRRTDKSGLDVYYAGQRATKDVYEFIAEGGEVGISLTAPCLSVESVTSNGLAVAYDFQPDTDPGTAGSTLDASRIDLPTPLGVGATVVVRFTYDALAAQIASEYAGEDNSIFMASVLIRRAIRLKPVIQLQAKAAAGFSSVQLRSAVQAAIASFFTPKFGAIYYPSTLRDAIGDTVIGFSGKPTISMFQLSDRALSDVEPITLRRNEIIELTEQDFGLNSPYVIIEIT